MYFAKSDWKRIRGAAAADGVALIPMGSLEAHGPHLPCGTDTCQVNEIVRRAVARTSDPERIVVFPTVEYAIVEWASGFVSAGVSIKTLMNTLIDVCRAAVDIGFRKIVFCQGHAGLSLPQVVAWQLRQERCYALYVDTTPYLMAAEEAAKLTGETIAHAGVTETSMMLALAPELVDMGKAVDGPTDLWGEDFPFQTLRGKPGVSAIPVVESLPDAVEGLATRATAQIGEKLFELYGSALAEVLEDLLSHPVPEKYLRPFTKPLE